MTEKTNIFEDVFEKFKKKMKMVKIIFLRMDDEIAQYEGCQTASEKFSSDLMHNLCFFTRRIFIKTNL